MDFKKQIDELVAKAREAEANDILKMLLMRADVLAELAGEAVTDGDAEGASYYTVLLEQVLNIAEVDVMPRIKKHRLEAGDIDDES